MSVRVAVGIILALFGAGLVALGIWAVIEAALGHNGGTDTQPEFGYLVGVPELISATRRAALPFRRLVHIRRLHLPAVPTAVGGIIGLVLAEPVVNALGTSCGTVAEVYGLCRPHSLGMQWAALVYAGFVIAGALVGSQLRLP